MTTKIRDNSIKTCINKSRKLKSSPVSLPEKEKKPARYKHGIVPTKGKEKNDLFKKAITLTLMIVFVIFVAVAYICAEGQAQAEPPSHDQPWMQALYEQVPVEAVVYDKKQIISDVLRANGVESNVCLDIAEAIVVESNKTNINVEMYLAIMHKESEFQSKAVSSAYAKGIMQIQMGTWDAYVKKHNLPVTRKDIFLPQANIMVASVILKELYGYYAKLGYQEPEIWNYVLAAYYAGPASVRNGIKDYHWQYINKVKKYYSEFESQITT